jgi:hypothetical protein
MTRRACRRDRNEPELVRLARQIGAVMWPLAEPVDFLVGWRGKWVPTEIKNGEAGKLTPQQILFSGEARARELPVWIWRTPEDVLRDLQARLTA